MFIGKKSGNLNESTFTNLIYSGLWLNKDGSRNQPFVLTLDNQELPPLPNIDIYKNVGQYSISSENDYDNGLFWIQIEDTNILRFKLSTPYSDVNKMARELVGIAHYANMLTLA